MLLPKPNPGRVIRYAYLWHNEAMTGQEDGTKPRPVVILRSMTDDGVTRVYVVPLTRTPPSGTEGIEIPADLAKTLGLTWQRCWAICSEVNVFDWAGPDLRPVPGKRPETCEYGQMGKTFAKIRDRVMFLNRNSMVKTVRRTA